MSASYVIQWKSKENGRMGKGTTLFEREDAGRLADELNREYPQIHHEVVNIGGDEGVEGKTPGPDAVLSVVEPDPSWIAERDASL